MKRFYSLIITFLAFLVGSTGCIHIASEYGIPDVYLDDNEPVDRNFEEAEPDEIQTDIDIPDVDADFN